MRTTSAPRLALLGLCLSVLVGPPGCGDDGSGTEASTNPTTQSTPATGPDASSGEATGSSTPTTSAATGDTGSDPSASASVSASEATSDATTNATTDATTGGGVVGQYCQEECSSDLDCAIMGKNQGYSCEASRCVNLAYKCTVNDECDIILSGWVTKCQSNADCPGQTCVDVTDPAAGRCATTPIPGVFECTSIPNFSEVQAKTFDGKTPVAVCANTGGRCQDSYCFNPCKSDANCAPQSGYPSCNVDTGRCECSSDADCQASGFAGQKVCNAGVCGCSVDADCIGSTYADTCYQGTCGCSSVSACNNPQVFDGTTKVCEGV